MKESDGSTYFVLVVHMVHARGALVDHDSTHGARGADAASSQSCVLLKGLGHAPHCRLLGNSFTLKDICFGPD